MTSSSSPSATRGPLLDHLDAIEAHCQQGDPKLRDILQIFGADGHYVIMFFMILPFLQPIPSFGLSAPFGLMVALVAVLAYRGRPPFVPKRWSERTVPSTMVLRIAEGSERVFEKISFLLFPRWSFLLKGHWRLLNTSIIVLNAILLALPVPVPFANAIPAWAILFQIFANLEEEGLFIILSYVQTIVFGVFRLAHHGRGRRF
jgi:hypothetical protein